MKSRLSEPDFHSVTKPARRAGHVQLLIYLARSTGLAVGEARRIDMRKLSNGGGSTRLEGRLTFPVLHHRLHPLTLHKHWQHFLLTPPTNSSRQSRFARLKRLIC